MGRKSMSAVGSCSTGALAQAASTANTTNKLPTRIIAALLEAVREVLQHLVARLDRTRVHLVRALRLDHAHELLDHVHVRRLERALLDAAEPVQARRSRLRGAARDGLDEQ